MQTRSSADSVPAALASAPAPITVVIVEDDPSVRDALVSWISQADGFSCLGQFADVPAAVLSLPGLRPNVALLDINLPGRSGIDCVRQLKPLMPDTQFVMLTVYDDSTHIFDALAAGATGYLLKRSAREALIQSLREVQAGGSPMTSNIARKVVQSLHQPSSSPPEVKVLSPRENQVLDLLAQGYLYKEIAGTMNISLPTVNSFVRRIYEKLHVHSRAQAVAHYTNIARPAPADSRL